MSEGTTFKTCGCRDEATGRRLGRKCPKLRRGNGWSRGHGTWYYQIELPPRADGTRRPPLRHGGFATDTAARAELDRARELLAIAPADDPGAAVRIADAITAAMRDTGKLPDLCVPKTHATWADVLHLAVGSVPRLVSGQVGGADLAEGAMILGLWA